MKYFIFYNENDSFKELLDDPVLKKIIDTKLRWTNHLKIGIPETEGQALSYLTLKYGDDIVTDLIKDRAPIPGVDYQPKKDKSLFKKKSHD